MINDKQDYIESQRNALGILYANMSRVEITPGSPLELITHANSSLVADAITTIANNTAFFPSNASTQAEIYGHMANSDIDNIFHLPGSVKMLMFLNVRDIKKNGEDVNGTARTTIPFGTSVDVDGLLFTLDSDIDISITNGVPIVERKSSAAFYGQGNLNSFIFKDKDNVDWLAFSVTINQVVMERNISSLTTNSEYTNEIAYEDNFFKMDIALITTENGVSVRKPIKQVLEDVIFDPEVLTAKITLVDGGVRMDIPSIYTEFGYAGNVETILYTTKGDITVPLSDYDPTSFKIVLGDGKTVRAASSNNITMYARSDGVLTGGSSPLSLEEIRERIITRSHGNRVLPITSYELEEFARSRGIALIGHSDYLTERVYSGSVRTSYNSELDSELEYTLGVANLVVSEINSPRIKEVDNFLVINHDCLYKRGDKLVPLSQQEVDELELMTVIQRVNYYNKHDIGYSPYNYIIGKNYGLTNCRVFDLKRPSMYNIILNKNEETEPVNILNSSIVKTSGGYDITIQLTGHNNMPEGLKNGLGVVILIDGIDRLLDMEPIGDQVDGVFKQSLVTDGYVNERNEIQILMDRPWSVPLESDIAVYIHNPSIPTGNVYYPTIELQDMGYGTRVFTKEVLKVTYGEHIKWAWSHITSGYTANKYKRYTDDVPLHNEEDVYYKIDNCEFRVVNGEAVPNILHEKDSPVLDIDGNPIYAHRAGDLIMDVNNKPIIDTAGGLYRSVGIITLDASYRLAQNDHYKRLIKVGEDMLYNWVTTQFEGINEVVLERTKVLYAPRNKLGYININVGGRLTGVDSVIRPNVLLTVSNSEFSTYTSDAELKKVIGTVIQNELSKDTIKKSSIRDGIIEALGTGVVGVVLKDFIIDELDTIISKDKFRLGKKVKEDYRVVYDFNIELLYVI